MIHILPNPDVAYAVADLESGRPLEMTGRELAETGLLIESPQKPAARIVTYRAIP